MMETQTAVSMSANELQALLDLARIATGRLSVAEQLYFDGLLSRFAREIEAQIKDMHTNDEPPHLGPAVPLHDG